MSPICTDAVADDSHDLMIRAGFLRQVSCPLQILRVEILTLIRLKAYSGIFHLLPLGLRVQEKTARLIEKHMRSIGGLSRALDASNIAS